jgi:DNA-binding CsgD family transcriptional regulator
MMKEMETLRGQWPTPARWDDSVPASLTDREIQILRLIARGLTNKEIASRLSVTGKTVESHKTKLYSKIGASGIVHAVRFAIREGHLGDGHQAIRPDGTGRALRASHDERNRQQNRSGRE